MVIDLQKEPLTYILGWTDLKKYSDWPKNNVLTYKKGSMN